ncbi:VWA domain-containing protein [Aliidiomarina indica]|uniref:VWA domain-containing protein n=1 Tax=Aliidiomarina indica TaxID=2749147 RepID=UPI00188F7CAF|nr:VWA domain-containing protein [Aliidiomarina indica]
MEIITFGVFWLRPAWLLLLIPLVLLTPYLWRRARRQHERHPLIAGHLAAHLYKASHQKRSWLAPVSLCLSLFLGVIALAGPAVEKIQVPVFNTERGAVLLFDASIQTRAQDVAPDRHTRMRFKAIDLVNRFGDGQLGLIAYAGDAFTVTPLTRDSRNILQSLTVLEPEVMPTPGNDPLLGFEEAARLLTDAGYRSGDIYWITGGISNRDMEDVRRFMRNQNWRVNVLAVGTSEGAPVRGADGELVRDERGRILLPRLEPAYLQRITQMSGGVYVEYRQDNRDIDALLAVSEADRHDFVETLEQGDQWRDLGPYIVLLILPFALFAARRGVLYMLPLLLIPTLLVPRPGYAMSTEDQTSERPAQVQLSLIEQSFLNADQRGERLLEHGDYAQAAEIYQSLAHRAQAYYRAGDFDQAAELYAQLDGPHYRYNLGNALAHIGALEEALAAYQEALSKRPDWQEAIDNYELVKSLLEQQQDGNGNGDPDAEQQDENGDSQSTDQQSSDTGPQEPTDSDDRTDGDDSTENGERDDETTDTDEQTQADADAEGDGARPDEEPIPSVRDYDDLSDEERAELEQLLRRVEEDPALILRNRLQREAQRRQMQRPPRGF